STRGLILAPARTGPRGPCHWLTPDGRCAVHADSPFGCAMFQCKLSPADTRRLQEGGNTAITEDHAQQGLYATIAKTLWHEGLRDDHIYEGKVFVRAYCAKQKNHAERKQARVRKKKARAEKKKSAR